MTVTRQFDSSHEDESCSPYLHGHTFTGNPLACAAALANLDLFESQDLLAHVARLAEALAEGLAELRTLDGVRGTRQTGVMVGIDLADDAHGAGHRAAMRAREHGAILRPLGNTLVINPPLALSLNECAQLLQATRLAITSE